MGFDFWNSYSYLPINNFYSNNLNLLSGYNLFFPNDYKLTPLSIFSYNQGLNYNNLFFNNFMNYNFTNPVVNNNLMTNWSFNTTGYGNVFGYDSNFATTNNMSTKPTTNVGNNKFTKAKASDSWNSFVKQNRVKTINLGGQKVYACGWSSFKNFRKEWLEQQKYMIQAAEQMNLTLVYSDMDRSKSASDASRKKKGNIVAPGGKSPHNYGTAVDICLFSNGQPVSSKSKLFKDYATLVKRLSNNKIEWGGDWKKKNEEHHFELCDWEKYKKPEYMLA